MTRPAVALCPMCGGPSVRRRLALDRSTVLLCSLCGHGITASAPHTIGAEHYSSSADARETYERLYLPARLHAYRRGLSALGPPDGRSLLDVGANFGHFVREARQRGWDAYGFEPGSALRQAALSDVADRMSATLDEARERGPYDVVSLWDVLEHLDDPKADVGHFRALVREDGLLLVRVPDARVFRSVRAPGWRLLAPLYLKFAHPTNPEEHCHHFTPDSLDALVSPLGFRRVVLLDAEPAERVVAGRTRFDTAVRRALHSLGARLPYEFLAVLERV